MTRLFPVLECPPPPTRFELALPPEPWPALIELSGNVRPEDMAIVVLVLCTYGQDGSTPISPAALATDFPRIAPGGIAVSCGDVRIDPSCCCGLEGWRSWYGLLEDGSTPWLGHDPSPWVEPTEDGFRIWADGGMEHFDAATTPHADLSRAELQEALLQVERSLTAFALRLRETLEPHLGWDAARVMERFRDTFIHRKAPG